jgi:hypothetical protein
LAISQISIGGPLMRSDWGQRICTLPLILSLLPMIVALETSIGTLLTRYTKPESLGEGRGVVAPNSDASVLEGLVSITFVRQSGRNEVIGRLRVRCRKTKFD